jgi:predicted dehydrogenase
MKAAIIGLGYRLEHVAKIFAATVPGFRIVGHVDPAPAGLPGLAKAGVSAGRAYGNIDALMRAERPDLVMIGSPNFLHLDHLRQVLQYDMPVFCEKPIVVSEAETLDLARLLASHGGAGRILVGLVLRYSPLYVDLRKALADGLLGSIASIEASEHISPAHGAFFMRDWRRHANATGGYMLEKCCHDLDLYQGAVGARPTRVASFGGRATYRPENRPAADNPLFHEKPSGWGATERVYDSDADIIDHQVALVEYATGASLAFHAALNVPNHFRRFCVIGTKGTAEGDFERNYFRLADAATDRVTLEKQYDIVEGSVHYGADEQMVADLMAHLDGGVPLPVSVTDALEAGLTAIKIDEARLTGRVVDLTETWAKFDAALAGKG